MAGFFIFAIPAYAQAPSPELSYSDNFMREQYVESHQTPKNRCSCVEFAKEYLGRSNEFWGNAGQIQALYANPYVGGLVLTTEGKGHVAVIKKIENNMLYLIEGNYEHCKVTRRALSMNSPAIRGFR